MINSTIFMQLNKSEKEKWLPKLFDLLYDNMRLIAPSNLSYEQEKAIWLSKVSPALDKDPRQIILGFVDDDLSGYIQYYTRDQLLMVEEIQIKRDYQRTFLFYHFCKYLSQLLPDNIQFIEAYADKRNLNSQHIMKKLGMKVLEEKEETPLVHFSGTIEIAKKIFM